MHKIDAFRANLKHFLIQIKFSILDFYISGNQEVKIFSYVSGFPDFGVEKDLVKKLRDKNKNLGIFRDPDSKTPGVSGSRFQNPGCFGIPNLFNTRDRDFILGSGYPEEKPLLG